MSKQQNVEVYGAKLLKRVGLAVDYRYTENVKIEGEDEPEVILVDCTKKSNAEPHQDLFTAFKLLLPHMINLAEFDVLDAAYLKQRKIISDSKFEKFVVTGFSLSGDGDDQGVVIKGHRILKGGFKDPINTRFTKLFNKSDYEYSGNLADDLDEAIDQVNLFLGGKITTQAQLRMEI